MPSTIGFAKNRPIAARFHSPGIKALSYFSQKPDRANSPSPSLNLEGNSLTTKRSEMGNTLMDVTVDLGGQKHVNQYKMLNCIGSGTFADVYRAFDKNKKKYYVRKICVINILLLNFLYKILFCTF